MTYSLKRKVETMLGSIILYLLQGAISIALGYTNAQDCSIMPCLPWVIFTHGIISMMVFAFILVRCMSNYRQKYQGVVRVLSVIYVLMFSVSFIIVMIYQKKSQVDESPLLTCSQSLTILIKVTTPFILGQIAFLQLI